MRKITHIALAAALAAMYVLPANGQSYRRNKVKTEPEKLTFKATIPAPGKSQNELFWLFRKWDSMNVGARFVLQSLDYEWQAYHGNYDNLRFGNKTGSLILFMKLIFTDDLVTLDVYDVYADWDNHRHYVSSLYSEDALNRGSRHKSEIVKFARIESEKCFATILNSLVEYLHNDRPIELIRLD